jgi:hypothetical protein
MSMLANLSPDSAAHLLTWSNRLYVGGAVLTFASAAMILYEKHSKNRGFPLKWELRTEITVIVAAFICLVGTVGAITFGNIVSHLKDDDLAAYEKAADLKISQANQVAATANQSAAVANENALKVAQENIKLGGQVSTDADTARAAEAALAKADKETSDFAHSLQQQQGVMAEQAKLSPQLTDFQIQQLASLLKPYIGAQVDINQTAETVVGRLASEIHAAFNIAGVKTNHSTMMGALYQGVSVAVHDPKDVPPIANALVMGLRQAGIDVHPVAAPEQVKAGGVTIFIGPN